MAKKYRYFSADFETTVYKGQTRTEVWAVGCVELYTEDVTIFHSLPQFFDYLISLDCNLCCYFHNLKFDGSFWLAYLLEDLKMKQALYYMNDETKEVEWIDKKKMQNNTFSYCISDMGQWYSITIKTHGHYIELRDSLKLLPFSVKRIGESFKTKHKKLDMQYEGFRYAGCPISDKEKEYIANDVLVVKEALEFMYSEGHNKLTIGSCCLSEYKKIMGKDDYKMFFPDLTQVMIDESEHYYTNADAWIRKSYKGGWCYVVKGKENQVKYNGITADVNSLYPSMMSSESGNYYPVGLPNFWTGDYIPDQARADNRYFFVRVKTKFYIKKNMLPFIQIKGNYLYRGTECLMSSDVYDRKTDKYYDKYYDNNGNLCDTRVELTLTKTDYILFKEHYNLVDFEILDGCWFYAEIGLFDSYIDKYKKIKLESKGAMRELAKLFLNNLYGKMASSTNSSFKVADLNEDKIVTFHSIPADEKQAGYIAVGSAITSYARNFTIRTAQKNYYGIDKPGFIYADTDSIHCDLSAKQLKGLTVHDKNFCCWKLESTWDVAIFTRQKTYIEHVIEENLEPIDNPYYNVKCAGMPEKCKQLFVKSMTGYVPKEGDDYDEEELEFLKTKRTIEDFTLGLRVPGKLLPKRIPGGIVLMPTTYEMR